jgi:enoyl-CoA hydratase
VLVDLPRRVGIAWAREMSLSANFIDAQTALRIGLVNHVKPHEELLPFALKLAEGIAEHDRRMMAAMRRDWAESMGPPIDEARRIHADHRQKGGYTHSRGADIAERREAVLVRSRDQRTAKD